MMASQPEVKIGDLGNAPVIPLLSLMIGGYFLWFGVHYWRSDIRWASDPVKSVLQGKGLPVPSAGNSAASILAASEAAVQKKSSTTGKTSSVPAPSNATGNAAANQNMAKILCAGYGWAPQQNGTEWAALVDLWNMESGWNQYAQNAGSGAYGIPQALPASKMASAGSDYRTNPKTQIMWGLAYIKSRYGSPAAAWAHEMSTSPHWY